MQSYNLINGNFININDSQFIESITISNGKIESINVLNPKYPSKDLLGLTVIPGFIDAHFHLKNFGKRLEMLNLKQIDSVDQIQQMIQNKIKELKSNDWIIGFGWDQNLWHNKQYPTNNLLNDIAPNNPIYLTRIDGHSAWVNQAAIFQTGTTIDNINNVDGGQVINDCIMIDNAMNFFKNCLPKDTKSQVKSWIKKAVKEASKYSSVLPSSCLMCI